MPTAWVSVEVLATDLRSYWVADNSPWLDEGFVDLLYEGDTDLLLWDNGLGSVTAD